MRAISKISVWIFVFATLGCADGAIAVDERQVIEGGDGKMDSPHGEAPRQDAPDCRDTPPLPRQTPPSLEAATLITSMKVPESRNDAIQYGCDLVVGSNGGIGLSVLIRAMNIELDDLFVPGDDGMITSVVIGHLLGWTPGQTGDQTEDLELRMYAGEQRGDDSFGLNPASYNPDGSPRVRWDAHLGCGQLQTEPGPLRFAIPSEASGISAELILGAAQVSADISVDHQGFAINEGTISGYVPLTEIVSIVSRIQDGCGAPNPPEFCAQTGTILQGDPSLITQNLVLPFLHGLDARLDPELNRVESCSGDDCNAMSVCVRVASRGVLVRQ